MESKQASDIAPWPATFGPWETTTVSTETLGLSEDEAVTFGIGSQTAADVAMWRLKLPPDPIQAATQLAQTQSQLRASEAALDVIPSKLDRFVAKSQALAQENVSFSGTQNDDFDTAETEMLLLLEEIHQHTSPNNSASPDEADVSFGLGNKLGEWSEASAQIQAMGTRLQQMIMHAAWVETQVVDQMIGRTIIYWTGNTHTIIGTRIDDDHLISHQFSLALALLSRHVVLRTLMVTTQGAVKISSLLAVPGGPVLALPVAWKYINQVLAEFRPLQELYFG